ncbi:NAD(P)H-dependent flavin oxidoreductase [Variovorax sp. M-6]|uniref:NAD(P)H-dependent flavin oxidoreductase n=1 Tax=Variovorax sp. M-6 TaxID=3233041 RepID=UPI003F9505D4
MPNLPAPLRALPLPIIAAPLFIVNTAQTIIAQCKAGVVGTMPSLNARPISQLEDWLAEISETLDAHNRANPERPAAPYGINLIVHKTNDRVEKDLEIISRFKVPLVITSLGARPEVNTAVHDYGGVVLHDIINNSFARKAIEKGADGLIAVAAGAGGHAGTKSPFALIQEIRHWFDGPLALSGAISTGGSILAAQAMGADFAYIGSAFIATHEARANDAYKQAIVDGDSDDIVYSNLFTGVPGNYLKSSIRAAGMDPDNLPASTTGMQIGSERADQKWQSLKSGGASERAPVTIAASTGAKAWKDVWGCGQGIGNVTEVCSVPELVARLVREYHEARERLLATA